MKKYERRNVIYPGEYAEYDSHLYVAAKRDKQRNCRTQCAFGNGFFGRSFCTGYCFRWKNDGGIVFKEAKEPQEDFTVVLTLEQ